MILPASTADGFLLQQERLERTNRLQQKPRKEGGVQNSGGSGSSKEKDAKRRLANAKYGSNQSLATSTGSPNGKRVSSMSR